MKVRKGFYFTFVFLLHAAIAPEARAASNPVAPSPSFSTAKTCASLLDLELYDKPYYDDYTPQENIQNFWTLHQRFGFIRKNGQSLLIAKDKHLSKQIIDDLVSAFGRAGDKSYVKAATVAEITEGIITDVTSLLTPDIAELQEVYTLSGPNCWNFCFYNKISSGLYFTEADEFTHWLGSPLAEKITDRSQLKPGDIIALRRSTQSGKNFREAHGAVYLSPRLVLTKNGADGDNPYRLADINEMYNAYYPNASNTVEIFDLQSFDEVLTNHPDIRSPELVSTLAKLKSIEQRMSYFYLRQDTSQWTADELGDYDDQKRALHEDREAFTLELRTTAASELKKLKSESHLSPTDHALLESIWMGFTLRAQSFDANR